MDFCLSQQIAGMTANILDGTYDRVENTFSELVIDHSTGAYETKDILLLYALKPDDPNAELPNNEEELETFLGKDHVWDMDEDGNIISRSLQRVH